MKWSTQTVALSFLYRSSKLPILECLWECIFFFMKVQWKNRSIASFLPAMMYNGDVFVTGILAEVPYFVEERERSFSATDQGQSCECDVVLIHKDYSVTPTIYYTCSGSFWSLFSGLCCFYSSVCIHICYWMAAESFPLSCIILNTSKKVKTADQAYSLSLQFHTLCTICSTWWYLLIVRVKWLTAPSWDVTLPSLLLWSQLATQGRQGEGARTGDHKQWVLALVDSHLVQIRCTLYQAIPPPPPPTHTHTHTHTHKHLV